MVTKTTKRLPKSDQKREKGCQKVTENEKRVTKRWPKKNVSGLAPLPTPLRGTVIKNYVRRNLVLESMSKLRTSKMTFHLDFRIKSLATAHSVSHIFAENYVFPCFIVKMAQKKGKGQTFNIFNISPVSSIFRQKHLTFPLFRDPTFTKQGEMLNVFGERCSKQGKC